MKSIKLMFSMILIGMISFTACSESEQIAEQKQEKKAFQIRCKPVNIEKVREFILENNL